MSHFNNVSTQWDDEKKIARTKIFSDAIISSLKLDSKFSLDIMDMGCGTGLLGLSFLDYAKSITGVDTAQKMLDIFDKKTAEFDHCQSKLIDLEKENLNQTFDLIISSMAFHHLEHPMHMVEKLKKMLNSNGALAVIDLDKEDGSFHPDNKSMGVKHFGFTKAEVEGWSKEYDLNFEYKIIETLEKNGKEYPVFLAIFR